MKPLTETDIRESFVNAMPGDLDRLPIPGLHEMIWTDREFLGWRDPQAHLRGYIVHWMDDRPVGLVVRSSGASLRPGIAAMCSMCHSPQPATQVRLFTAPRAGEAGLNGNTLGTYMCEDLACSLLIRVAPPHLNPPEQIARRAAGLTERMQGFTTTVMETA
ncbi:FBP domain-containing protein [Frigoribacterium sp. 2-23]|uniref:FBP domain-containing protein n=1 Tax=Frigoribacterium sp. 2-23 TaxID=3415006 RepID=UPI003C6F4F22